MLLGHKHMLSGFLLDGMPVQSTLEEPTKVVITVVGHSRSRCLTASQPDSNNTVAI
jgi:hypothetical protein